jgi:hypothetical protein
MIRPLAAIAPAILLVASLSAAAQAQPRTWGSPTLVQISADTLTNTGAEHATELESDTFAYGSTIVAAFQVGRFSSGGASAIGWATSTDAGATWSSGYLPGITQPTNPGNPFPRASDPAVAYNAKYGEWLVNSLPVPPGYSDPAVIVSRSVDGINWDNPINVSNGPIGSDKNWITCDNNSGSPYYGNCYVEWDDGNGTIQVNTSSDGGKTWSTAHAGGNGANGLGGQPLAQPNGTVVIPFSDGGANILAIVSTNGGASWSNAVEVASNPSHNVATMRAPALPTAAMDAAGKIYVAWSDCAFRAGCKSNDIVYSTSTDGVKWTAKTRVPIDHRKSTVDHFLPGLGIDPATSGRTAHLALTYFYFPNAACTVQTCRLYTGYVSSDSGGRTWNPPTALNGPMDVNWLANAGGYFVGDYLATAFTSDGLAHSAFSVAFAASKGLNEAMYTTATGLAVPHSRIQYSSAGELPYPNAHSDHPRIKLPPKADAAKAVDND